MEISKIRTEKFEIYIFVILHHTIFDFVRNNKYKQCVETRNIFIKYSSIILNV